MSLGNHFSCESIEIRILYQLLMTKFKYIFSLFVNSANLFDFMILWYRISALIWQLAVYWGDDSYIVILKNVKNYICVVIYSRKTQRLFNIFLKFLFFWFIRKMWIEFFKESFVPYNLNDVSITISSWKLLRHWSTSFWWKQENVFVLLIHF